MIDVLKDKLYTMIDKYGLDSPEALEASQDLDNEIIKHMELINNNKKSD